MLLGCETALFEGIFELFTQIQVLCFLFLELTLDEFTLFTLLLQLSLGYRVIIDMVLQFLLFQLLFNSRKSLLGCQELFLDQLFLLLDAAELLLQLEEGVLHFHDLALFLLVCL